MKTPPARPRWTTLAGLIAAVLALHLLLLGLASPLAASPVPRGHSALDHRDAHNTRDHAADTAERTPLNSPPSAAQPDTTAPPALRAPLHTVRWITHPAAPAAIPTAARSAPPPTLRAAPQQAAPAPPPAQQRQSQHPPQRSPSATQAAAQTAPNNPPAAAPATPASPPAAAASTVDPAAQAQPAAQPANDNAHETAPALPTQTPEDATPSDAPATVVALLTTPSTPPVPSPAPAETRTQAASPPTPATTPATQPAHNLAQAATPSSEARASALPPAQPPASTRLAYDVIGNAKGLNYRASSTLDWTQADGRYSARTEVRVVLLGSRVQTSAGRVDGTGLLPERFSDKTRSERAAHFDRTRQTIRFSNNQPDASLQAGAQDRLSLFMQLAGLLQARPDAYPVGHVISLQVAGTSDAEVWRFRVAEDDTLTLPAGTLRARHLVREPREPRDSLIDIWFAPELAHLPVRIRITQENGDRVDQQLREIPPMPKPPQTPSGLTQSRHG
jgi:hypothetical protein